MPPVAASQSQRAGSWRFTHAQQLGAVTSKKREGRTWQTARQTELNRTNSHALLGQKAKPTGGQQQQQGQSQERQRIPNTLSHLFLPGIEEQICALAQNRLDVTQPHRGIVHLVPLSIAALQRQATLSLGERQGFEKKNTGRAPLKDTQYTTTNHNIDFYLYEAVIVSCLTAGTLMHQDSVQGIEERFSRCFRRVCAKVQTFRILHILKRVQEDSDIIPRAYRKQPEKTFSPNTG